jgi:ADP-ribosylglycohydrolase
VSKKHQIGQKGFMVKVKYNDIVRRCVRIAIAKVVNLFLFDKEIDGENLCNKLAETIRPISEVFAERIAELKGYLEKEKSEAAQYIAWAGMREPEFEKPIITSFVIPTVLASLWSIIKHKDSWENAVAEVIGFGGDVDTLGSIVGGIMGAKLGVNSIPSNLKNDLHNRDYLKQLSESLYYLLSGNMGDKDILILYK